MTAEVSDRQYDIGVKSQVQMYLKSVLRLKINDLRWVLMLITMVDLGV